MADVLCPAGPLEDFIRQICLKVGTGQKAADEVAHHLVRANLSGHDSHGVLRMRWYVDQIDKGQLKPDAEPHVVREFGATALIDAEQCFGQYSTIVALEWAIEAARQHGVAVATIRHSMHIGRLGEYPERAAAAGMVGIIGYGAAGTGTGIVVPFGGRERFLGTNPWSFGVPAGDANPMIFDAATSVIAEGKIRVAQSKGVELPPGRIIDESGLPSTRPDDFYAGGALLPLGGDIDGHKGYGMSMAAALIGGLAVIDDDISSAWDVGARHGRSDGAGVSSGQISGVTLIVIDPEAFGGGERYGTMVGNTLAAARRVKPADGVERVLTPGEPEVISRDRRGRDGIPLPDAIWQDLTALSERFGIPLPTPN
jgi:LDH2 family malate/lactate/ureidoglycolate dehydrogenase